MKWMGIAIGLCAVLAACNPGEIIAEKVAEQVVEKSMEAGSGGQADVDIKDGQMTVKTDKGEVNVSTGDSAKIPDSFPKDVYVPDGATVMMAMELPEGHTVTLKVKGDPAALQESYIAKATEKGWEKKSAMDMGTMKMLGFEKEGLTLTVMLNREGETDHTMCQITATKKAP